jgi:hypothetical protein
VEFLHQFSNNTWGQSYNDAGDNFGGTANNGPIFYGGIPATALPGGKVNSALRINAVTEAHPITPNFRQVDVMGGYTAAAGSAFVYSANLPERVQLVAAKLAEIRSISVDDCIVQVDANTLKLFSGMAR